MHRKKPVSEMTREELVAENEALVKEYEELRGPLAANSDPFDLLLAQAESSLRDCDNEEDPKRQLYHLRRATDSVFRALKQRRP